MDYHQAVRFLDEFRRRNVVLESIQEEDASKKNSFSKKPTYQSLSELLSSSSSSLDNSSFVSHSDTYIMEREHPCASPNDNKEDDFWGFFYADEKPVCN